MMDKTLIELLQEKESALLADIELLQNRLAVAIDEHHSVVNKLRVNGVNAPHLRYCATSQCQRGFVSARQKQIYCSTECRTSTYTAQDYWTKRSEENRARKKVQQWR